MRDEVKYKHLSCIWNICENSEFIIIKTIKYEKKEKEVGRLANQTTWCDFLNFVIFLNSASSATALVFYLPGVCTHTDTEGKQRKARVRNIFKNSEKNTIFNEHPVPR